MCWIELKLKINEIQYSTQKAQFLSFFDSKNFNTSRKLSSIYQSSLSETLMTLYNIFVLLISRGYKLNIL